MSCRKKIAENSHGIYRGMLIHNINVCNGRIVKYVALII